MARKKVPTHIHFSTSLQPLVHGIRHGTMPVPTHIHFSTSLQLCGTTHHGQRNGANTYPFQYFVATVSCGDAAPGRDVPTHIHFSTSLLRCNSPLLKSHSLNVLHTVFREPPVHPIVSFDGVALSVFHFPPNRLATLYFLHLREPPGISQNTQGSRYRYMNSARQAPQGLDTEESLAPVLSRVVTITQWVARYFSTWGHGTCPKPTLSDRSQTQTKALTDESA